MAQWLDRRFDRLTSYTLNYLYIHALFIAIVLYPIDEKVHSVVISLVMWHACVHFHSYRFKISFGKLLTLDSLMEKVNWEKSDDGREIITTKLSPSVVFMCALILDWIDLQFYIACFIFINQSIPLLCQLFISVNFYQIMKQTKYKSKQRVIFSQTRLSIVVSIYVSLCLKSK